MVGVKHVVAVRDKYALLVLGNLQIPIPSTEDTIPYQESWERVMAMMWAKATSVV